MQNDTAIIEKLGGVAFLAAELAIPYTTVHHWSRTGKIPRWRRPALAVLAQKIGNQQAAEALIGDSAAKRAEAQSGNADGLVHDASDTTAAGAASSGKGHDLTAVQRASAA